MPSRSKRIKKKSQTKQWRKLSAKGVEELSIIKTGQELMKYGGPTSDQLFVIDNKPSQVFTKEERKQLARNTETRLQKSLILYPHMHSSIQRPQVKKRKNSEADKVKRIAKRQKIETNEKHNEETGMFDLWAKQKTHLQKLAEEKPYVNTEYLQKRRQKNPSKRRAPNEVPAVPLPAPGASYNPDYDSHQALLAQAVKQRTRVHKEEDKLDAALVAKRSAGVYVDSAESDSDNENEGEREASPKEHVNMPHILERKTKVQRNKLKRRRHHELEVLKRRKLKERRLQESRVEEIIEQVEKIDKERRMKREAKKQAPKKPDTRTRKLGPDRFAEQDIPVALTSELPSSMRVFNPKYSLVEDRFYHLQRRNLVESRNPGRKHERRTPQKYRLKFDHMLYQKMQEQRYADL